MAKAKPDDDTEALMECAIELLDIEDDQVATAARIVIDAAREEYLANLPAKIKMLRMHSFLDENDMHRQWPAGSVITNRDEIVLLADRKATFEVI